MLYLLLGLACRNKDLGIDTALPGEGEDTAVDADGDGVPASEDCDDSDATV